MAKKRNNIRKQNTDNPQENIKSKSSLNTIATIAGIVLAFLTGSFSFYQIGKDSQFNKCEGEKNLFLTIIDSLKQEQIVLQNKYLQAEKNIEICIDKNDSIIYENNRLKNQITESKCININKIASLIKAGKLLLENQESIQEWKDDCITFLEKNYNNEVANFKGKTNYTFSDIWKRKNAIENGINILKSLN